jgi:hypothetical protein
MSHLQIAEIIHFLFDVSDVFFTGLNIAIPLVFIIFLLKKWMLIDVALLIRATNILLLITGLIFLVALISDSVIKILTDDTEGKEFIMSMLLGPHWYQVVLPLINYAILPQLEWRKANRNSIILSMVIVTIWLGSLWIIYSKAKAERFITSFPSVDVIDYAKDLMYSLLVIVLIYFFRSTNI